MENMNILKLEMGIVDTPEFSVISMGLGF